MEGFLCFSRKGDKGMDVNDIFMSMANAQGNKKKKAGYYTDVRADIKRKEKIA